MSPARPRRGRGAVRRPPNGGGPSASQVEWLYGFHPIREALRARRRRLDRLWIREGSRRADEAELMALAEKGAVPVEWVDRRAIEAKVGTEVVTQGVVLRAGPLPEWSLRELLEHLGGPGRETPGRIVALDGVEDPQNVGALARVAESVGVDALLLADRRAPDLTPAVARASAGAIEWLPVARVPNLVRALGGLRERGYWVVAAAPEEGDSLFALEDRLLSGDLIVVLGAEGKGIRPSVAKLADHRVWLPMQGRVASLNVSTAAAVILYDVLRRSTGAG